MVSLWTTRVLSLMLGLLMVAATGIGSQGIARVAAMLAVLAVLAGTVFRPAATLAVLLSLAALVLANPTAALAATSGLSAAVYLVLRHAAATCAGLDAIGGPTMVGAVGFTFVGLVATAFPLQVPWLPLVAPLAAVVIYLLAARPFLGNG